MKNGVSDKVVPVEPDSEMVNRGADEMREALVMLNSGRSYQYVCGRVYKAMLAAAPADVASDVCAKCGDNYDAKRFTGYVCTDAQCPQTAPPAPLESHIDRVIQSLLDAANYGNKEGTVKACREAAAVLAACKLPPAPLAMSAQLDDWIMVETALPQHGQLIEGRNSEGRVWKETWDSDEPIGYMKHWRPVNPEPVAHPPTGGVVEPDAARWRKYLSVKYYSLVAHAKMLGPQMTWPTEEEFNASFNKTADAAIAAALSPSTARETAKD